eukprot:scaffold37823_cov201-Skeletonema_marinoi.AAC.2
MNEAVLSLCCSLGVLMVVSLGYSCIKPNGGQCIKIHLVYFASAICLVAFLPTNIAKYVFTELTVSLVGAMYPVYRATRAVCTPDDDDDKEWLQYWMLGGVLFMITTWVDDVIKQNSVDTIWLGSLLFIFYWLYFPLTCGALVVYEKVTAPYLGPKLKPLQRQMNNFIIYLQQMLSNAFHLYLVWIIFMFLPAGLKRIVAIAIGTVYPTICSITAVATEEIEDDTYWLTYWSVYGCLFLIMDVSEDFLGRIPGFYTLIIFTTIYLMLPMFRGADKIFRKVLVPLAGLHELLVLRDAITIKKQMLKDLDPERAAVVQKSIAKFFDGSTSDSDPSVLKEELMQGWGKIKLPNFKIPFGKAEGGSSDEPTEKTNLV